MKQYGQNQATEFSRKQISVIFAAAKRGDLKIEKWVISRFYDLADFYGIDWSHGIAEEEQDILAILDKVFSKNMTEAQERIDLYTEQNWNTFTAKAQAKMSREFVA